MSSLTWDDTATGDLLDFNECCDVYGRFFAEGLIPLQTAVDNLQHLAEIWGLVEQHGQDFIQHLIAFEHDFVPSTPSQYEADYCRRIIAQWEADDVARPAPQPARSQRRSVPKSTVDAFQYVASLGDPAYLAKWLRDHSDVARDLLDEVA